MCSWKYKTRYTSISAEIQRNAEFRCLVLLDSKRNVQLVLSQSQIVDFSFFNTHFGTRLQNNYINTLLLRVFAYSWVLHLGCLALPSPLIAFHFCRLPCFTFISSIYSFHLIRSKTAYNVDSTENSSMFFYLIHAHSSMCGMCERQCGNVFFAFIFVVAAILGSLKYFIHLVCNLVPICRLLASFIYIYIFVPLFEYLVLWCVTWWKLKESKGGASARII